MNSALLQIKTITDDGDYFIAASLDIMLKKHADIRPARRVYL